MRYQFEQARTQAKIPFDSLTQTFDALLLTQNTDTEWKDAQRQNVVGATGLPFSMPICEKLLNSPELFPVLNDKSAGDMLFVFLNDSVKLLVKGGEYKLDAAQQAAVIKIYKRELNSRGILDEKGNHIIDLKSFPVSSHFGVNLLIGDRAGCEYPLFTTPKSALDAFGRGSFRAGGALQVLATRYTLSPEENGEPVNRQFYLLEDGRQIFYSANISENVKSAFCRHSTNHSVITYETECGLKITRTIFILPQKDGFPEATEIQNIKIENFSDKDRTLRIVATGMFGIAPPVTIANDVIYANVVQESEAVYENGKPVAVSLHSKPDEEKNIKRFALILLDGETMDDYTMSLPAFLGGGTVERPLMLSYLPSRMERKMTPFFAMGKSFAVSAGETKNINSFAGMSYDVAGSDVKDDFDKSLGNLIEYFKDDTAVDKELSNVLDIQNKLSSYLVPETGDKDFDSYVACNLPFQVYYQTFVSRSFAWTQKSYRETGFREIQDILASMYYLVSAGKAKLARELITMWAENVFRDGYAYHNFTWRGKEPGEYSDDQLWLVQAVYRYVTLTEDYDFLTEEISVADEDAKRPLWDTMIAILCYSGQISVGEHGLPLLDKADWNDTLRFDKECLIGPEKIDLYKKQLEETGEKWGVPFKNTLTESCMNACLLKIAADHIAELSDKIHKDSDGKYAKQMSEKVEKSMQKNAWKDDFFARALINDSREGGYTYVGAKGDGLSFSKEIDGNYFLNSFSWSILADIADENQIAIMLDKVDKYLKTEAGLKLCTTVRYELLGANTATALYFPGDRENGGVFKHAAMMATAAMLKAAKTVKDSDLAKRLIDMADFMIQKTLPYTTMDKPYVIKGNPRFCTQYNNSDTGEFIGPILSGTASWLNLVMFEMFGFTQKNGRISFCPILLKDNRSGYKLNLDKDGTALAVEIEGRDGAFRVNGKTKFELDGKPCGKEIELPRDKSEHYLKIIL